MGWVAVCQRAQAWRGLCGAPGGHCGWGSSARRRRRRPGPASAAPRLAEARPREETVRETAVRGALRAARPELERAELPAAGPALWRPESPASPAGPARRGAGTAGVPRVPLPRVRPSGRAAGGSDAARPAAPSSSASLLRGCPGRAPRPSPCRSAATGPGPLRSRREPRPLPLRRAPSLLRLLPFCFVSGRGAAPTVRRWAAGPALGGPWKLPGPERVGGERGRAGAGPALRAPLAAAGANPSALLSRSSFSAEVSEEMRGVLLLASMAAT